MTLHALKATIAECDADFGLFIEGGFVAIAQADEEAARKQFLAAQALRPQSVEPLIGLGYIALNKMHGKEACALFDRALARQPAHELASVFRGLALLMTTDRQKEGKDALQKAVSGAIKDPSALHLAKTSLAWAAKDLEKTKAPFFL